MGMKVVKLNRRFKQYKEHGHTVALRFNGWDMDANMYEKACRAKLTGHGWDREADWFSYFGDRNNRTLARPYWITFRNEADLTLILLSAKIS
jgi:hypothetical protein